VISKDDLKNVKMGSVLVSPSTTVDYVPALKKVIAIVTEEGGVLSHASVISRELHIPCIIGTKFATQVLKDGDLVEVDAERGIVKIIKKAESRSFRKGGANKGVVRILERAGK
jgi:pyruvate,water dikinase